MLLGKENSINQKLVQEISEVFPIQFREYFVFMADAQIRPDVNPKIFFINLMDVGGDETDLLGMLQVRFPESRKIAIHTFQEEIMVRTTLKKGFDGYLSIFDLNEDLLPLLSSFNLYN